MKMVRQLMTRIENDAESDKDDKDDTEDYVTVVHEDNINFDDYEDNNAGGSSFRQIERHHQKYENSF